MFSKYFRLTNYTWMFCEGYYLHRLLVNTFEEKRSLKFIIAIGWSKPDANFNHKLRNFFFQIFHFKVCFCLLILQYVKLNIYWLFAKYFKVSKLIHMYVKVFHENFDIRKDLCLNMKTKVKLSNTFSFPHYSLPGLRHRQDLCGQRKVLGIASWICQLGRMDLHDSWSILHSGQLRFLS